MPSRSRRLRRPIQDAKPALNLIEPGAVGRNKVKMHVGMSFKPAVLFGLVSVETSEMLLHLLEERTSARMPILATTQYSGEGIDEQFERKETGQAVRRRLNEFCKVVIVGEQPI